MTPPSHLYLKWCRRCGRDDRVGVLKEPHYRAGKKCKGKVLTLDYVSLTIWSSEWENREE